MLRRVTVIRVIQESSGRVGASVLRVSRPPRRTMFEQARVSGMEFSEVAQKCREHVDSKGTIIVFAETPYVLTHSMEIPRVDKARRIYNKANVRRLYPSVEEVAGVDPSETYWSVSTVRNGRRGIHLQVDAKLSGAFASAFPGKRVEFRALGLGWNPLQVGHASGRNAIVLWSKERCGVSVSLYQGRALVDLRLPRGSVDPGVTAGHVMRTLRFFADRHGQPDRVTIVTDYPADVVERHIPPSETTIPAGRFRVLSTVESPHVRDAVLQLTHSVPPLGRGGRYIEGTFLRPLRSWRYIAAAASVVGTLAFVAMVGYGLSLPLLSKPDRQNELNQLRIEHMRIERERRLTEMYDGAVHARAWLLGLESTRAAPAVFTALEGALIPGTDIQEVVIRGTEVRSVSGYSPSVAAVLEHLGNSDLVRSPSLIGPVVEEVDLTDPKRRRQRFSLSAEVVTQGGGARPHSLSEGGGIGFWEERP